MGNISELRFDEFDPAQWLAEQRALFVACFPENVGTAAATVEHYRWKFQTPIGSRAAREYVGNSDGALIAYYAALPYRYVMDGIERVAAMVCDVMTHPNQRGKGVFTKIGRFSTQQLAHAGFDFATGYPIRPEVIPGHLKVGWHIVQRLPLYLKVLRANDLLRSRNLSPALAAPTNILLAIAGLVSRIRPRGPYQTEILSRLAFLSLSDYDRFATRWRAGLTNALIKDQDFLAWRTGAPETHYEFVTVRDSTGDLVSVAIVRVTVLQGVKTLGVLDLMVLPAHSKALRALNAALTRLAQRHKAQVIAMMLSPYWARTYRLWRFGFFRSPAAFSIIVKILNPTLDLARFREERNWQLMWIDSDDL